MEYILRLKDGLRSLEIRENTPITESWCYKLKLTNFVGNFALNYYKCLHDINSYQFSLMQN